MTGDSRIGGLAAFAAFFIWGISPVYFKFLGPVTAQEVSLHRAIWAGLFLAIWLTVYKHWASVKVLLKDPKILVTLFITALCVASNWFGYAWAVIHNHIEQASLGYFINPLVNVLLGFAFLGERLNKWQIVAVVLAGLGVANQIIMVGEIPWLGLWLAATFGTYGLLRKKVAADAGQGLFVEILLLSPFLLIGIFWLEKTGQGHAISGGWPIMLLLALGGLLTAIPLFLFSYGARRLNLATLGLIQYIAPSLQFSMAIYYGEKITGQNLVTFALIWLGLAVYTWDLLAKARKGKKRLPQPLGMDPD